MNSLKPHSWMRMQADVGRRVYSCSDCGMLKEKMPGSRGGYTRFVLQNGSCHDEVTIDQPSCDGAPIDFGLRRVRETVLFRTRRAEKEPGDWSALNYTLSDMEAIFAYDAQALRWIRGSHHETECKTFGGTQIMVYRSSLSGVKS